VILEAILSEVAVQLTGEGIGIAVETIKNHLGEKGIKGSVVKGEFLETHAGHVLIAVKNLRQEAEIVIFWGPWMRRLTLYPKSVQYLVLKKGLDAVPIIVFSSSKADFEFVSDVVNINDDQWDKIG
jgi:hypothetical protein